MGPVSGWARMPATIGVSIMPGATAFSRRPAPAQSGPTAVLAHPVGHGQLGGRVGQERPVLVGQPCAGLLVAGQAGLHQIARNGRLHRGRVGADGHGGAAGRQERTQSLEQFDGAEEVDRREERTGPVGRAGDAGAGDDARDGARPGRSGSGGECGGRRDGPGALVGPGEVGHHLRVVEVDADHAPARRAESGRGGPADTRRGPGDDDGAVRHGRCGHWCGGGGLVGAVVGGWSVVGRSVVGGAVVWRL